MATLSSRFKTDSKLAREGKWIEFPNFPNEDGTVPGFLMARRSAQNKKYAAAVREQTAQYTNEMGGLDAGSLSEEVAEQIDLNVFLETLLLDWRNFIPYTDVPKEYSVSSARMVFNNPDWHDLYKELITRCSSQDNYQSIEVKEDEIKNS